MHTTQPATNFHGAKNSAVYNHSSGMSAASYAAAQTINYGVTNLGATTGPGVYAGGQVLSTEQQMASFYAGLY